ncbi:MAG: pitrilysin family protein [Actinomycetota bacterium]|nr:pitrilysin family protein [Actinomycetota bacterium]
MFRKELLENGIVVLMEQLKTVRSFTCGIWVRVGSRNEPTQKNGISHFLEHMFFKGTKSRSARDIAVEIDGVGGDLNAFTAKENTAFYVKVLDTHIDTGLDILTDVFCHSVMDPEEMDKERGVIKEEIKMVEDTPDDLIHDLFSRSIWGMHGIGQPVLGTRATVASLERQDLVNHIKKFYGTRDTIVSCAGSFDPETLLKLLNEKLGGLRRGSEPSPNHTAQFSGKVNMHHKDLSEVHVCLGVEGLPQAHPRRYEYYILNTLLGAGISSRLFQEIREKRGLVYSIYSFASSYIDTGLFGIYAGSAKSKAEEVVSLVLKELKGLPEELEQTELDRAKEQLKGSLILGLESTSSRMQNMAKQEIYFKRLFTTEEIIKGIDSVTLSGLQDLAALLFRGKSPALTVLGPLEGRPFGEVLPPL